MADLGGLAKINPERGKRYVTVWRLQDFKSNHELIPPEKKLIVQ